MCGLFLMRDSVTPRDRAVTDSVTDVTPPYKGCPYCHATPAQAPWEPRSSARKINWRTMRHFRCRASITLSPKMEIDENLARAELTTDEKRDHLRRRKELWEAKQAESGKRFSTLSEPKTGRGNKGFAAETAPKNVGQDVPRFQKAGASHACLWWANGWDLPANQLIGLV